VHGIAAPIFAANGLACGAVAVATPTQRINPEVRANTIKLTCIAAMELTRKLGSDLPAEYRPLHRNKAA
jgi:IclR family transcriptional regulator, acetate operon repressor